MFKYGKPVTSFDVADAVREIRKKQPEQDRTKRDEAVEEAVQQAVNRIVSLEEVDDLDRFVSEQYGSLPDQGADLDFEGGGDFEDPRMWADVGFSEMDLSVQEPESSDAWEQRNLEELIRRRQTNPGGEAAIPPGGVPRATPGKPQEGIPPVAEDDRTIELSDMEGRLRKDAMRRAAQMNRKSGGAGPPDTPGQAGAGKGPSYGPQSIQPVSDSVSQAMAQVQQRNGSSDETGQRNPTGPQPRDRKPKKEESKGGPPIVLMLVALFVLIALVVGVAVSGLL